MQWKYLIMKKTKIKASIIATPKFANYYMSFRIPISLAKLLISKELSNDQKINLVKSYTDDLKDEDGKAMERIPRQQAVALIMALEVNAL